jgi:hypothetical protein
MTTDDDLYRRTTERLQRLDKRVTASAFIAFLEAGWIAPDYITLTSTPIGRDLINRIQITGTREELTRIDELLGNTCLVAILGDATN